MMIDSLFVWKKITVILLISFNLKSYYVKARIFNIYNLLMKSLVENKRTNLGKIYFEETYINKTITVNANDTWFIK